MSDSLSQKVVTALWNDLAPECFLFVFSLNLDLCSLHMKEELRERDTLYAGDIA